jgi:hypothetical protein
MRGNFTRDTRERARRAGVRSVLLQQGRPLVDADWNEQAGITADRAETLARHVIGIHGAPREQAGFGVSIAGGVMSIGAGHLYADGLALHNPAPLNYAAQLPASSFPALTTILNSGQRGFVYTEAVLRPTSAGVEPYLSDPALGGIDPVVREEVDWSIRVVPLTDTGFTANQLRTGFATNQTLNIPQWRQTTGGLDADVQTEAEVTDPTPCELPPTAGYLDQLNRLYRVEVQSPGAPGTATFKWTEDAGVEAGLQASGAGFILDLPQARAEAWFPVGAIVEVINNDLERAGEPGPMGTITSAPGQPLVINGVNAADLSANVRIRRWATMPISIPAGNAWVVLSKGIKVRFCAGHYARGSAWTIPGRTVLGDIMWPPYRTPDQRVTISGNLVGFYAPTEGRRRYAPLAIIARNGGDLSVADDLRDIFSPLTDQRAVDIRFDDSIAQLNAANVQEAIDALATRDAACCTWHVLPTDGWQRVFDEIRPGQNGKICFAPGNYTLKRPVQITGKGHLKLVGAGPGTKIWCRDHLQALHFEDCASVEVSDMLIAAEQGRPTARPSGPAAQITAALQCTNCGPVRVERTTLIASAQRMKRVACLRIDAGSRDGSGDVRVRDNDIVAGDLGSGILILNGADLDISGNRIRVREEDRTNAVDRWLADGRMLGALTRLAYSHAIDFDDEELTGGGERGRPRIRDDATLYAEVSSAFGDSIISFYSSSSVRRQDWTGFLRTYLGTISQRSNAHARWLLGQHLKGIWPGRGTVSNGNTDSTMFRTLYTAATGSIAPAIDTAIIIAGSRAGASGGGSQAAKTMITDNHISGALNGIRIARSNMAGKVAIGSSSTWVQRNRIVLRAVPLDMMRVGILLGNPQRAWVSDNDVMLETADSSMDAARRTTLVNANFHRLETEGVRLYGALGPLLNVSANSLRDCVMGIRIDAVAVAGNTNTKQWLVADNLIQGARRTMDLDPRCRRRDNVPT